MSKLKILSVIALCLTVLLIVFNISIKKTPSKKTEQTIAPMLVEKEPPIEIRELVTKSIEPVINKEPAKEEIVLQTEESKNSIPNITSTSNDAELPKDQNRIALLFQTHPPQLPIVETITYTMKTPWLSGRAAYLEDYASHYKTSKHFIARSLHEDYFAQHVSKGDRFNVFRQDKDIEFHLVADLSRLKLWFYYFDKQEKQRVLLKTYPICAGKVDLTLPSGSLTPLGVFELGSKVAIYNEKSIGLYQGNSCEMVTIFGKRWIPFLREVGDSTGSCKGLGIHGLPWKQHAETGELVEYRESIGQYDSKGCIRLLSEDIAEIFSIVITQPSYMHIVSDFTQAKLPGIEA